VASPLWVDQVRDGTARQPSGFPLPIFAKTIRAHLASSVVIAIGFCRGFVRSLNSLIYFGH